jgi:hypothetical protein
MNLQIQTISKINALPQDLLFEVNDFIDSLFAKHKISTENNDSNLVESDMSQYLDNLNEYETLLAEGKIKW